MTDGAAPLPERTLAAELALGLLDGDARADALRRALHEPAFAAEVRFWQTVAADWLDAIEPAAPDDESFAAIERAIDGLSSDRGAATAMRGPGAGTRAWAIAASLAAVLFAGTAMLALSGRLGSPAPRNVQVAAVERPLGGVAQIEGADGVMLSAFYDPASGTMALRIADLSQGDLAPELWVIPEDGKPRSLGLIERDRSTIALSAEQRRHMADGSTIALTLEPRSGAPHAAPTGDVLGTAQLQALDRDLPAAPAKRT
jgi:anti-sigma-K factor RskA